jgi:hypothetical protein
MTNRKLFATSGAALVALVFASGSARAATCDGDDRDRPEVCKPRDIYLMPGIDGVGYAPNQKGTDPFFGVGVHFAPYQWSHNNDHFGPSQGSVFIQASLLRSTSSKSTMALLESGLTLSFERNSARPWLIPYFGDSVGGIVSADLPKAGYDYPFVGLHVVYTPHLMLDLQGGYMMPFIDLDTLRGPRGEAVLRVSMW